MSVDVLYLAWNRLEMTKVSFATLRANTDWTLVDRLVIYDDGSKDGTREWLERAGADVPVPAFDFRRTKFRSPPATMNDAFALTEADIVAKIDNDIAVPKGWLNAMLGVMDGSPNLEALGMEAARTGSEFQRANGSRRHSWITGSHIGGVGLIRSDAIRKPLRSNGRYGWTEYQRRWNLCRGWIVPDLPVLQLDLLPFEPWVSLADYYVSKRWARRWPAYDPLRPEWWEWLKAYAVPELEAAR